MKLYVVKDVVIGSFLPQVFVFHNEAEAKRWFEQSLKQSPNPSDLQLYYVCEFDDEQGAFVTDSTIASAVFVR